MSEKRTPSDFLKAVIGRPVVVKLNSGTEYRGEPPARALSSGGGPPPRTLDAAPPSALPFIRLTPGPSHLGILSHLDGYMNIAMEQTEEYVHGVLKNKYGDAFIRGNNVLYISTTQSAA